MAEDHIIDLHFQYLDVIQHWHAGSQPKAGGDALLTFLNDGWQTQDTVLREEHWFAGMRLVTVYHFELSRDGTTLLMPVIGNPYVTRLIGQSNLRVLAKNGQSQGQETPQPGD